MVIRIVADVSLDVFSSFVGFSSFCGVGFMGDGLVLAMDSDD
jgi:hypothetical protein